MWTFLLKAQQVSGPTTRGYGLGFSGYKTRDNFYAFMIVGNW